MESKTSPQGAPLDAAQLRAILASEEGRKLLALLHHTDSAALTPYLQSPEAAALLQTLR